MELTGVEVDLAYRKLLNEPAPYAELREALAQVEAHLDRFGAPSEFHCAQIREFFRVVGHPVPSEADVRRLAAAGEIVMASKVMEIAGARREAAGDN
jgi:hypothetical protein